MTTSALLVFTILPAIASAQVLEGIVIEDHTNAPVSLAEVRVVQASTLNVIAELETNGQGRFRSPILAPGEYRLEVSRPNFLKTVLRVAITDAPLTVTGRLVRCAAIAGQVTDRQGNSGSGADVFALPQSRD